MVADWRWKKKIFTLRVLWEKTAQGCCLNANYPRMSRERERGRGAVPHNHSSFINSAPQRYLNDNNITESQHQRGGGHLLSRTLIVRQEVNFASGLLCAALYTHIHTETHKHRPESPVIQLLEETLRAGTHPINSISISKKRLAVKVKFGEFTQ